MQIDSTGKPTPVSMPPAAASSSASFDPVEPVMDRVITEVVCPPMHPLTLERLINPSTNLPNLTVLKEHLQREGRLSLDAASFLIKSALNLFKSESNLLELKYPITVCGDLHGQFYDLLRLFEVGGDPANTQYLFLGDYVDRGCFSSECVLYLYAHKMVYPKSFHMLRGNHECRQLTAFFNFKDESVYKYNINFYNEVMTSFDHLPLAAIINKSFFAVHGGLSPDITTLEEIKAMDRFMEIPREGPMCVAQGTLVACRGGYSIPIEEMDNEYIATHVVAWDEKKGLGAYHSSQVIVQGEKECVEIELEDGRTLQCTADHRILNAANEWVNAETMSVGSIMRVGRHTPMYDCRADSSREASWSLQCAEQSFSMSSPSAALVAMALARLCGVMDSAAYDGTQITCSHQQDADIIADDIRLVTNEACLPSPSLLTAITINVPIQLRQLHSTLQSSAMTAFVQSDRCPLILQRLYLSAVFSGSANAPTLNQSNDTITPITLHSTSDQVKHIYIALKAAQMDMTRCRMTNQNALTIDDAVSFANTIGFVYSANKSHCLTAAVILQRCTDGATQTVLPMETSVAVLAERIGAHILSQKTSADAEHSFDPFHLRVVSMKSIGSRPVYDLSVPECHSFTANSIVVHNCDLLWSDPYEDEAAGGSAAPDVSPDGSVVTKARVQESTQWFGYNDTRQCSYVYGIEAVKQFLKSNRLTSVIRAHEAQLDGYKMQMINKASGIPRVITIFSAPNYCDVYKNKAACLKFDNSVLNIKQFIDSAHPYYLPNFMDVFQWSLPFVAEKVTDMLVNVLDYDSVNDEEEMDEKSTGVVAQRGGLLKKKVTAVTKLLRMYRILRTEHDNIMQLKQLIPNHKIPSGLLSQGQEAIMAAVQSFDTVKAADLENEKRPTPPGSPKHSPTNSRNFKPNKFSAVQIQTSGLSDASGQLSSAASGEQFEPMSPPVYNPLNASVMVSPNSPVLKANNNKHFQARKQSR